MRKLVMSAALLTAASAASAEMNFYKCEFNARGRGGWIMEQAYYGIDDTNRQAVVADRAVFHSNGGKAKAVRYNRLKNNSYILDYKLKLPARGNRMVSTRYRIRLDTAHGKATIRVQAGDSDLSDTGAGKCTATRNLG